ncbi:MAG: hypothetical protein IPG78_15875 [Ignavibacteria bacterium]|nr:hypothetical protein [Ignavibacteria bacterium]
MNNTKLIQILKTFSKEEMKEFDKFVSSPYHSRGRDMKKFFSVLKSYYPDIGNEKITYEKVYSKLHPGEKYSKNKGENMIRVLSSDLIKLADEFLTYEDFKSKKLQNRISLIYVYIKRNLQGHYTKLFNDTEKNMHNLIDGYTSYDYFNLYVFKMYELTFKLNNNDKLKSLLESQAYFLIVFFLCAQNFIDHNYKGNIIYNIKNNEDLVEKLMREFNFKNYISHLNKKSRLKKTEKDILELSYYGLLYTLNRSNEAYISKVEKLFYKTKHLFRDDHKLSFYFLLNDAFDMQPDLKKSLILYKKLLEDKIFDPPRIMPNMLYMNILFIFSEFNPDDAEKFIEKYLDCLDTDMKDSYLNFGFAYIEFKRKNFSKALDYISKVDIAFFYFKYHLKTLYLQLYFELNYTEEAKSMTDTFKHFLKKNRFVSEKNYRRYSNFLNYYIRLLKIKTSGNKSGLKIIHKDISGEERLIFFKKWFLEKADEMI